MKLLRCAGLLAASVACVAQTTCTDANGVQGVCVSTSRCSGTRTRNRCPGAADIQCCTYGTCRADGVQGTCLSTSNCNGRSTAGLCPGPSDIKCCTPDYGTCTANGQTGRCIATSACTGVSTAGLCPGPADIKCCTASGGVSEGVPQPGVELIKSFEGLHLSAYPDPLTGGLPITIGYGSTRRLDGTPFQLGDTITKSMAELLLKRQLEEDYLPPLERIPVWPELNTNQRGAILSFAYNLGANFYGARGFTTITRVLRTKAWDEIEAALILYRNPGSRVEAGLLRRRRAEAALFLTPVPL